MQRKTPNYNDKIKTIMSYFGVSEDAAKYIFHRRRRGFPWKNDGDVNYLKWTIQLQNALIKADELAIFDWGNLKFNQESKILMENGINIEDQPKTIQVNLNSDKLQDIKEDDEGWALVTNKKAQLVQNHLLKTMGLLPQNKKSYINNTSNGKKYVERKKGNPYISTGNKNKNVSDNEETHV